MMDDSCLTTAAVDEMMSEDELQSISKLLCSPVFTWIDFSFLLFVEPDAANKMVSSTHRDTADQRPLNNIFTASVF